MHSSSRQHAYFQCKGRRHCLSSCLMRATQEWGEGEHMRENMRAEETPLMVGGKVSVRMTCD